MPREHPLARVERELKLAPRGRQGRSGDQARNRRGGRAWGAVGLVATIRPGLSGTAMVLSWALVIVFALLVANLARAASGSGCTGICEPGSGGGYGRDRPA